MSDFYSLTINKVTKEAAYSVSIQFNIPDNLKEKFKYKAGQYLTLKTSIKGEEVRRAYSIWTAPTDNKVSVLVKKIENGLFSTYANDQLKEGDVLDVMTPEGNFTNKNGSSVYFAAGSGITPVLSMIKQKLSESNEEITLFYSNRNSSSVIFKEEIDRLKNDNSNFNLYYIYTQEENTNALIQGRINKSTCGELTNKQVLSLNAQGYYLCGPEEMINEVKDYLTSNNVSSDKIHFELFVAAAASAEDLEDLNLSDAKVTMIIDDDEFDFNYNPSTKESMLGAGIEKGLDLPFSCKGGVCCTCKAKILEGKAVMTVNYALTDEEVEEGYILTCQSYPTTANLTVSFDE